MKYPIQMREGLRVIRMTPELRARLERIPAPVPRIELRLDGLAVRMIDFRHRRTGTRYRHVEDERGRERWYRIEVVTPPAVELPPGAIGGQRHDEAMLMHHLADLHPSEVGPYLRRMETEDIGAVAAETYEVVIEEEA